MRVSVLPFDPGYDPDLARKKFEVTLDGVPQRSVFTADDVQGVVLAAVYDEKDRMIFCPLTKKVKREWRRGKVEIKVPFRKY